MNPSLPDDRDRELAARLGQGEKAALEGGDPLATVLGDLRQAYRAQAVDSKASARIWGRVERATRSGADRPAVRRVSPLRLVWSGMAVAAAIAAVIVLPDMLRTPEWTEVAVATDQPHTYTTADGSEVTLRPRTTLFRSGSTDSYRLEGEAFFAVTSNPERVFSVATSAGTVEVLGTEFNVAALETETSVYLKEGRVRYRAAGEDVILAPGQAVSSTLETIGAPFPTDGTSETDWMRGELEFASRSARQVASELGRHFGLSLELPESMSDESLSGRIPLNDSSRALEDFATVLGGRFIQAGTALRFIPD